MERQPPEELGWYFVTSETRRNNNNDNSSNNNNTTTPPPKKKKEEKSSPQNRQNHIDNNLISGVGVVVDELEVLVGSCVDDMNTSDKQRNINSQQKSGNIVYRKGVGPSPPSVDLHVNFVTQCSLQKSV